MKNVLILSFHYSQSRVIGSIRTRGLAKHLREFGWNPIVLTAEPCSEELGNVTVVATHWDDIESIWRRRLGILGKRTVFHPMNFAFGEMETRPFAKVTRLFRDIFAYPDLQTGWRKYAIKEGMRVFKENGVSAIISTSKPETSHLVASTLQSRLKIPWIADFRDLWTENPYYGYSRTRRLFERHLEQETIRNADAISTVSRPLAARLEELHKGRLVDVIPNGYDPDDLASMPPLQNSFRITYTGSFYQGRRRLTLLLKSLKDLGNEGAVDLQRTRVEIYAPDGNYLERDVAEASMQEVVHFHGWVDRSTSLEKQRSSQLLLLLPGDTPNDIGICTGKVFDYLAARRPILSIGVNGSVVGDLLKTTRAGVHASTLGEVKDFLTWAYQRYSSTGNVPYHGIRSEVERFSQIEMARKFALVLDRISSG